MGISVAELAFPLEIANGFISVAGSLQAHRNGTPFHGLFEQAGIVGIVFNKENRRPVTHNFPFF